MLTVHHVLGLITLVVPVDTNALTPVHNELITTTLVGVVMHTPRPRNTRSGERVLNLDVTVRQRVKRGGEWQNETLWVDVVIFGPRADGLASVVQKGGQIGAYGELHVRPYTGRDGSSKLAIELFASNIWPLNWTPREREPDAPPAPHPAEAPPGLDPSDDIPF